MSYASAIWRTVAKSNLNKLQIIHNKMLWITKLSWFVNNKMIHSDLQTSFILHRIIELAKPSFYSQQPHSNELINQVY